MPRVCLKPCLAGRTPYSGERMPCSRPAESSIVSGTKRTEPQFARHYILQLNTSSSIQDCPSLCWTSLTSCHSQMTRPSEVGLWRRDITCDEPYLAYRCVYVLVNVRARLNVLRFRAFPFKMRTCGTDVTGPQHNNNVPKLSPWAMSVMDIKAHPTRKPYDDVLYRTGSLVRTV
jgi:hypothetical protein